MADQVAKLADVHLIEHETRDGRVVLKFSGRNGGKKVRLEVSLHPYSLRDAAKHMREGAKYQADMWATTQKELGSG